jgi:phage terminase large subunit
VAFLFGGDWGFATDPTVGGRLWIDGRRLYVDAEVYKVGCDIDYTPALFDSLGCRQEHEHAIPCTDAKGSVVEHPAACTLDHSNPSTWPRREDCIFHHDPCLGSHCDGMARSWTITADSARPETISYMQRHGYPKVEPARKGPGSVEEGINFLKSYDIIVHPRCRHAIDELTHYSFKAHPLTGLVIPVLQDKKNHVIDMLRYAVEPVRVPVPEKEWATW